MLGFRLDIQEAEKSPLSLTTSQFLLAREKYREATKEKGRVCCLPLTARPLAPHLALGSSRRTVQYKGGSWMGVARGKWGGGRKKLKSMEGMYASP